MVFSSVHLKGYLRFFLFFVDALAGDVFGDKREDLNMRRRTADFVLNVGFTRIEAPRKTAANFNYFVLIHYHPIGA